MHHPQEAPPAIKRIGHSLLQSKLRPSPPNPAPRIIRIDQRHGLNAIEQPCNADQSHRYHPLNGAVTLLGFKAHSRRDGRQRSKRGTTLRREFGVGGRKRGVKRVTILTVNSNELTDAIAAPKVSPSVRHCLFPLLQVYPPVHGTSSDSPPGGLGIEPSAPPPVTTNYPGSRSTLIHVIYNKLARVPPVVLDRCRIRTGPPTSPLEYSQPGSTFSCNCIIGAGFEPDRLNVYQVSSTKDQDTF
jgi:hypothetical protein